MSIETAEVCASEVTEERLLRLRGRLCHVPLGVYRNQPQAFNIAWRLFTARFADGAAPSGFTEAEVKSLERLYTAHGY
jgi:hypothetical protein